MGENIMSMNDSEKGGDFAFNVIGKFLVSNSWASEVVDLSNEFWELFVELDGGNCR
jgi:hypothetical protein